MTESKYDFKNMKISEFDEHLAARDSVPGGGGASALVGAIGIALGSMVGEFTVDKPKYADVEEDIKALMKKAAALRLNFEELIDKDAEAFKPLSKAYALPKDSPNRDEVMEECLRNAADVPFEIFKYAMEALDIMDEFSLKGSKMIVSDAATGATILRSALKGAAINVKVNTRLMKDRDYAATLDKFVDENLLQYSDKADEIYGRIYETLSVK